MDISELQECLKAIEAVARTVGKIIREAANQEKRVEMKESIADLVTETDTQVEHLVIQAIRDKYPTHSFIGEESTSAGEKCILTDNPTWIIDPIDGTNNFVHAFPMFAVSIGLAINKEPVLGVIHNPMLDEMYTAIKGHGAYCNGKKLHVSSTKELGQALVCTEFGSSRDPKILEAKLRNMHRIVEKAHGIRQIGAAVMVMGYVSRGCLDGYASMGLHCWDLAAGVVLLREAGATVQNITGGEFDLMARQILCAATPELAQQMAALLEDIPFPRD